MIKIFEVSPPKTIMENPGSHHNYFGWPTVARLKNGRIAVGASGNRLAHVCPFGRALFSFSDDEGETFTAPAAVIDTVLDDRDAGLCPFGDSGLIVTSFNNTREVQRTYNKVHPRSDYFDERTPSMVDYVESYLKTVTDEEEAAVLGSTFRVSFDNGMHFGPLRISPVTSPHGPCELRNGKILWLGTDYATHSHIMAYDLDPVSGRMTLLGEIDTASALADRDHKLCEPYAFEVREGYILALLRADSASDFTTYESHSEDGGRTWSKPVQILSRADGAPSHIMRHSSGVLVAVFGHRARPFGIKVILSADEGKTWQESEYLVEYPEGTPFAADSGYPSTVELRDGSLLTVYYSHVDSAAAVVRAVNWRLEITD